MIIDDTHYYEMGGDSDHRPLCLRLSIDCSFVEPEHTVITKKFLPKFKYDKSKIEKYQFTLIMNLGNLLVIDSNVHMGADGLADLLHQCVGATAKSTFGVSLWEGVADRDITINHGLMLIAI